MPLVFFFETQSLCKKNAFFLPECYHSGDKKIFLKCMRSQKFRLWIGALLLAGIDQQSKYWIRFFFDSQGFHPGAWGVHLYCVWNPGISFGCFSAYTSIQKGALIGFLLSLFLFLIYQARRASNKSLERHALMLLIGGALGNLIDRLFFGQVFDFLYIGPPSFPLFICNLADIWISIGGALWFWAQWQEYRNPPSTQKLSPTDQPSSLMHHPDKGISQKTDD